MSSLINLKAFGDTDKEDYKKYLYMVSVKTQYAGIEIHKLIIHLLKYLNGKYLHNFNVFDEGQYWETGDENLILETFKRYTNLIDSFASSIENSPRKPGESFEAYFTRLINQIQKLHKK